MMTLSAPGAMRALLAPTLLCLSVALGSAQESQAPCSDGQVPMCYGEWADCSISPATDVDVYQFIGVIGERVRVTIDGKTNNFDPRVEVYRPDNTFDSEKSCTASATCSLIHTFTLTMDGLWTLVVSDLGGDNPGGYALDLQRLPPSWGVPTIDYGETKTISLGHGSDHDWLQFEGTMDTNIRITVNGLTNNLDPQIEVWDPLGGTSSKNCSASGTCSFTMTIDPVVADGTHYIAISDVGNDNTGSLNITLTCILGICPPPSPPGSMGTNYCRPTINSTGNPGIMSALGSPVVADNDVHLVLTDVPDAKVGLFFMGMGPTNIPLINSVGTLCVAPPILRQPVMFSCHNGQMHYDLDLNGSSGGAMITSGSTWYFQAWFRDENPGPSNTSDGLFIQFQ